MTDLQSSTERSLRIALWCGVIILAAIGIAVSITRAISVASGGLEYEQIRQMVPAPVIEEAYVFDRWFVAHPVLIFLQIIPGSIFLLLAPFQFSSRIRTRHLWFHRWSGRLLVVAALIVGLSGLVLGALFPYGGPASRSAVFVAGALFLFALIRAFIAIRRRDVVRHREWMIRMFAIGLGIATVRVVGLVLIAITGGSFQDLAGISFWSGWVITFGAAELWIRHTRPRATEVVFAADRRGSGRTRFS